MKNTSEGTKKASKYWKSYKDEYAPVLDEEDIKQDQTKIL